MTMNDRSLAEELNSRETSACRRYLEMFVGKESVSGFLIYELVMLCASPMPGALGYVLRSKGYNWLFGRMGRHCVFGRSLTLRSPGHVFMGDRVLVDDNVVMDAKGVNSRIELGSEVLLGRSAVLTCYNSIIAMGSSVTVGPFCLISDQFDPSTKDWR